MKFQRLQILLVAALVAVSSPGAFAQGTAFTYQGSLTENGAPADGVYDLTFRLTDAATAGGTVGASNTVADLVVSNGLFTASLDFGAGAFTGANRWLEIAVRPGTSTGAHTPLTPRQRITPGPYAIFAGGVAAAGITGTLPAGGFSGAYVNAVTLNNAANSFSGGGAGLTGLNASQLTTGTVPPGALNNAWKIGGNSGTTPGTHFLGTTDNQPLEFKVNNQRALRIENPAGRPNMIAGHTNNSVAGATYGTTISGGSDNSIVGNYNTTGGGLGNSISSGWWATIGGGAFNRVAGDYGVVAGGVGNTAGIRSAVGGGTDNLASGDRATIPGGEQNAATSGYTFAAGRRAKANHRGAFVWADSTDADFASTTTNQFLIRASGGVGIGTATITPGEQLQIGNFFINANQYLSIKTGGGNAYTAGIKFRHSNDTGGFNIEDNEVTGLNGLAFVRYPFGTSSLAMFIDRFTGNVGIGTASSTAKLSVNGNANNTTGAWGVFSDRRLKNHIEPMSAGSLDRLLQLQGVTYEYARTDLNEGYDGIRRGWIAQQVQGVFPEWVSEAPDGMKMVTPVGFNALAVEALRELRNEKDAQFDRLQKESAELKQTVQELSRLVESLKSKSIRDESKPLQN